MPVSLSGLIHHSQKLQSFTAKATVVTQSPQKFHNRSCKVSQQKQQSYVVTQLPQKFHNRSCKVSQQKQQSTRNHRKIFATEAAKFHSNSNSRHAITAKVSQRKPQSFAAKAITGSCKTVIGNGTTTVTILHRLFQNVILRNDRKSHPIVSLQGLVASS